MEAHQSSGHHRAPDPTGPVRISVAADFVTTAIVLSSGMQSFSTWRDLDPSVWRWQERSIEAGIHGLLRDKTRPSRIPRLSENKVAEVIRLTLVEAPPADATQRTVRDMAKASGVSRSKVHDIWQEASLVPHRFRQFKLSNDKA